MYIKFKFFPPVLCEIACKYQVLWAREKKSEDARKKERRDCGNLGFWNLRNFFRQILVENRKTSLRYVNEN